MPHIHLIKLRDKVINRSIAGKGMTMKMLQKLCIVVGLSFLQSSVWSMEMNHSDAMHVPSPGGSPVAASPQNSPIKKDDTVVLEAVCKSKPETVNEQDRDGKTPLHVAAENKNMQMCKRLIKQGARLDAETRRKWTPLHIAVMVGDVAICAYLIDKGANPSAHGENGFTPLHYAAINMNLELCKLLIKNHADKDALDDQGLSPLERFNASINNRLMRLKEDCLEKIRQVLRGNIESEFDVELDAIMLQGE